MAIGVFNMNSDWRNRGLGMNERERFSGLRAQGYRKGIVVRHGLEEFYR